MESPTRKQTGKIMLFKGGRGWRQLSVEQMHPKLLLSYSDVQIHFQILNSHPLHHHPTPTNPYTHTTYVLESRGHSSSRNKMPFKVVYAKNKLTDPQLESTRVEAAEAKRVSVIRASSTLLCFPPGVSHFPQSLKSQLHLTRKNGCQRFPF